MKQKGYTLTELILAIAALASLGLVIFIVYAVVHFVAKFW